MFQGKKTYIIAGVMIVYALAGYLLGKPGADLDVKTILEALAIGALRAGVAKS